MKYSSVIFYLFSLTLSVNSTLVKRDLSGIYGGENIDLETMACIVNSERGQYGYPPLSINPRLVMASEDHSGDQYNHRNMDHYGSDGSTVTDRARHHGYGSSTVAENVAYNQVSVEEVMDTWLHSPGHRANIMNPSYTHFGAGKVGPYWTQVFGRGDQSEDYIPRCY